jgi:hypothetical protein
MAEDDAHGQQANSGDQPALYPPTLRLKNRDRNRAISDQRGQRDERRKIEQVSQGKIKKTKTTITGTG